MHLDNNSNFDNTLYFDDNKLITFGRERADSLDYLTRFILQIMELFTCFGSIEEKADEYYKKHAMSLIESKNRNFLEKSKVLLRVFNMEKPYIEKDGIDFPQILKDSKYAQKEMSRSLKYLSNYYKDKRYFLLKHSSFQVKKILKISKEVRRPIKLEMAASDRRMGLMWKWASHEEKEKIYSHINEKAPIKVAVPVSLEEENREMLPKKDPVVNPLQDKAVSDQEISQQRNLLEFFHLSIKKIRKDKEVIIESASESEEEYAFGPLNDEDNGTTIPLADSLQNNEKTDLSSADLLPNLDSISIDPVEKMDNKEIEGLEVPLQEAKEIEVPVEKQNAADLFWERFAANPTLMFTKMLIVLIEAAAPQSQIEMKSTEEIKANLTEVMTNLAPLINFVLMSKLSPKKPVESIEEEKVPSIFTTFVEVMNNFTNVAALKKDLKLLIQDKKTFNLIVQRIEKAKNDAKVVRASQKSFFGGYPAEVDRERAVQSREIKEKFKKRTNNPALDSIISAGETRFAKVKDDYFKDPEQKSSMLEKILNIFGSINLTSFFATQAAKLAISVSAQTKLKTLEVELGLAAASLSPEEVANPESPKVKTILALAQMLKINQASDKKELAQEQIKEQFGNLAEIMIPLLPLLDNAFAMTENLEQALKIAQEVEENEPPKNEVIARKEQGLIAKIISNETLLSVGVKLFYPNAIG